MPRMARLVVPGLPHHVTQRGGRRQTTFFDRKDYQKYLSLLVQYQQAHDVRIWAYCLMPNHVHLIAVPAEPGGLSTLFRATHQRYARYVNRRKKWQGHLWQERFHSCVLDEAHCLAAVRYIELNPVRAGLCDSAADWPWSSVHAHSGRRTDPAVDRSPLLEQITDWRKFLATNINGPTNDDLRKHTGSGLPGGNDRFIRQLELKTGRPLRPGNPGRKPDLRNR